MQNLGHPTSPSLVVKLRQENRSKSAEASEDASARQLSTIGEEATGERFGEVVKHVLDPCITE